MIILDTNVVSEPMRTTGDPSVVNWLDRQNPKTLFLTSTSLSELLVGIEYLPKGRRKAEMATELSKLLGVLFGDRILPFDKLAAESFATLVGQAGRNGKAVGFPDGQIAAIAHVHGFTVATRDTGPFEAVGVPVINPWSAARTRT